LSRKKLTRLYTEISPLFRDGNGSGEEVKNMARVTSEIVEKAGSMLNI
jgi:hypothetical protein